MARRKFKLQLADGPVRVLEIDPQATQGATLGTDLYLPSGVAATPTTLLDWLGGAVPSAVAPASSGTSKHQLLAGLTIGDDHPQYTQWAQDETVTGDWRVEGEPTFANDIWYEETAAADSAKLWYQTIGSSVLALRTYGITESVDPYAANVVLLLRMQGANGSTTFTDSTGRHSMTALDNAYISTAQHYIGSSSAYMDGASDGISTPSDSDFGFGSGDFTIEMFVRPTYSPSVSVMTLISNFDPTWTSASAFHWQLTGDATAITGMHVQYKHSTNFTVNLTSSAFSMSYGAWHHVAISRSGDTWRYFVDGVQVYTHTTSITLNTPTNDTQVGKFASSSSQGFLGYIGGVRITKGTGRYTTTFSVPAADFPDAEGTGASTVTDLPVYEITRSGATPTLFNVKTTDLEHNGVKVLETLSNVGSGSQVYKAKTNYDAALRSIIGSGGILATQNTNDITLTIANGDYGDITVSAGGATWTVDSKAITFAKMQDIATTALLGRKTAGTGAIEAVTIDDFTADATPDAAADYVLTWDASASLHKKVLLSALGAGGGATGPTGPTGPTGATGATGATGPAGAAHIMRGAAFVSSTVLTTSVPAVAVYIENACTITKVVILGDATGSCTVGIKKVAVASYTGPSSGSSIVASDPPTVTSDEQAVKTSFTGWTTSIDAGDVLIISLTSVTTFKRLSVQIFIQE